MSRDGFQVSHSPNPTNLEGAFSLPDPKFRAAKAKKGKGVKTSREKEEWEIPYREENSEKERIWLRFM